MKKFRIQFKGRKINAIDKLCNFFVTVEIVLISLVVVSLLFYWLL